MRGFLATMTVAELDAIFAKLRDAISGMTELTDEQKTETITAIDEQVELLMALREQGNAFTETMRPLAPKLRALILDPTMAK